MYRKIWRSRFSSSSILCPTCDFDLVALDVIPSAYGLVLVGAGLDGADLFLRARAFEMSAFGKLSLAAVVVVAVNSTAHAGDPRCNKPPYGGSPDRYRAVVETSGQKLESVAKTLEEICNMKFGGADRTALYNLGFTDAEINRTDTSALALDMLKGSRDRPKSN
jgi:hypothetical protein